MLRKVKFINSLTVFFLILFMAALVFLVLVSEPWYESPKTGGRAWYMYIKTWNYLQMHFLVVILTSFGVRWKVGCSQVWLRETSLCGGSCLPELDPKCLLHSKGRRKRVPQLRERSLGEGNGNPLQYSFLENPIDRGAWRATVHGATKSQTRLSDSQFNFHRFSLVSYLLPTFSPLQGSRCQQHVYILGSGRGGSIVMFSLKQPSLFPWDPRTCLRARKKTRKLALGLPTCLFILTAAAGGQTCSTSSGSQPGGGGQESNSSRQGTSGNIWAHFMCPYLAWPAPPE